MKSMLSSSSSSSPVAQQNSSNNNNRVNELIRQTPIATILIIGVCILLYLLQMIFDLPIHSVTLCPQLIIYKGQIYRIVTNSLFHSTSIMHIGMNMLSCFTLAKQLELHYGTIRLLLLTMYSIVLTSCLYVFIAYMLYVIPFIQYKYYMYTHSIGFSGVLFHYLVLECSILSSSNRNLFGSITVPSYLYPWVILIIIQIMIPNISFLGHLCGILVGMIQLYTPIFVDYVFPNEHTLKYIEDTSFCTNLRNNILSNHNIDSNSQYIRTTTASIHNNNTSYNWSNNTTGYGCSSIIILLQRARSFALTIKERIYVSIFGRGSSLNSNIILFNNNNSRTEEDESQMNSLLGSRVDENKNKNSINDSTESEMV